MDGTWSSLHIEDGYLIFNFGIVLEKSLSEVTASEHSVVKQKDKMRISIIDVADPRVGP